MLFALHICKSELYISVRIKLYVVKGNEMYSDTSSPELNLKEPGPQVVVEQHTFLGSQ